METKVRIGLAGISFKPFWSFTEFEYQRRIGQLTDTGRALEATVAAAPATFQDAEGAAAAARRLNQEADFAILDVCTYPEGQAAGAFFDALTIPLVLWSRNEAVHQTHIGHNSFCGANFLAGNLRLRGQLFRHLYGEAAGREFRARLRTTVGLIGAAKRSAGARIGLFGGGIVPKFYDIDIQPADRKRLEERYRITFVGVPTEDLVKRAAAYKDAEIEPAAREFAKSFAAVDVPEEALRKQARLGRALREISEQERFASAAVRCWPELPQLYGAWPCPSVGALNQAGLPVACEGDPGGALDMLLASRLSDTPTTLMDIVDWDEAANTFAIWHCGPTAGSWADREGARLIAHNVDGRTPEGRPASGLPAVVDMQFAPGPVTVFRTLGALDDEFVVQGELVQTPERKISGSFGTVGEPTVFGQPARADAIRDRIFERALPHHYTAARGRLFW